MSNVLDFRRRRYVRPVLTGLVYSHPAPSSTPLPLLTSAEHIHNIYINYTYRVEKQKNLHTFQWRQDDAR